MPSYKLKIQYNGAGFFGWQEQPDCKTVQGELNKALRTLSKTGEVKSMGSGRTDRGVHALEQVVLVSLELEIDPENLLSGLNSLIHSQVKILECETVEDFHPIRDALKKEYIYLFSLKKNISPFHRDFVSIAPANIDIAKLKEALGLFIGKHNFEHFSTKGTPVKSTIREIFSFELEEAPVSYPFDVAMQDVYVLKIQGTGFLKQMVRLLVGTVWNYSLGKITKAEVEKALSGVELKDKLAAVAPPNGLYLSKVFYP